MAEIFRDDSISEHSGSITTERMEKTSRDKNLENQCESSKSAIFSWYFNALSRWCPEEASHSIFFPMYFQIFIKFGTAKKPSKGPQMALNVLV